MISAWSFNIAIIFAAWWCKVSLIRSSWLLFQLRTLFNWLSSRKLLVTVLRWNLLIVLAALFFRVTSVHLGLWLVSEVQLLHLELVLLRLGRKLRWRRDSHIQVLIELRHHARANLVHQVWLWLQHILWGKASTTLRIETLSKLAKSKLSES